MPIYPNIYQTLLPGPIVELRGYLAACGLRGRLYAYLNYNGPTGTARDELAEGMLALALERGALTPGQTIVEAVSGPFATALTLAGLTAGCFFLRDPSPVKKWDAREKQLAGQMLMVVLPLTLLSAYLQYTHCLRVGNDGGWWVGQSTYGDLPMHMSFITSLKNAAFPPVSGCRIPS